MAKDKATRNLKLILGCMVVFGAATVAVIFLLKKSHKNLTNSVTLEVNNVENKTLSFESLSLKPGDTKDFFINFKSNGSATYAINLDFNQTIDGGLTDYINVEINYDDFSYSDSLTNLFIDGQFVEFECKFDKPSTEKVEITYIMPTTVGNEAMGKTVDFDIVVAISQK